MATSNFGWITPAGLGASNNPPADITSAMTQIDTSLRAAVPLGWLSFATTWSQVGGPVLSIGNGTLSCRWVKIGRKVAATYYLSRGSTTHQGTAAAYLYSLPTGAVRWQNVAGAGMVYRGDERYPIIAYGVGPGSIALMRTDDRARISSTPPGGTAGTWAVGDELAWTVEYEAGS